MKIEELDAPTALLVSRIEEATKTEGLARVQRALAIALWRCAAGHPGLRMVVDFDVEQIRLREGGQRVFVEVESFGSFPPREGTPHAR